ncbi:MAG: hypothetical protein ACJAR3_002227, partial [Roseivirga sp.]
MHKPNRIITQTLIDAINRKAALGWELAVYRHLNLYRFNSLASISCTSRKDNVAPILEKTKSI